MRKIPTLFERDWDGNRALVTRTPHPDCDWVFPGEGRATKKLDGTSCLVRGGRLFKRYELKPGKAPPEGFEPASPVDEETGKQPGWVPVGDGPEDAAHREGFSHMLDSDKFPAVAETYELVGPKVQGNPDGFAEHRLVLHGQESLHDAPRDFDGLREYLQTNAIEGIVWHHPDGRMAKLKSRDFGIPWPR